MKVKIMGMVEDKNGNGFQGNNCLYSEIFGNINLYFESHGGPLWANPISIKDVVGFFVFHVLKILGIKLSKVNLPRLTPTPETSNKLLKLDLGPLRIFILLWASLSF